MVSSKESPARALRQASFGNKLALLKLLQSVKVPYTTGTKAFNVFTRTSLLSSCGATQRVSLEHATTNSPSALHYALAFASAILPGWRWSLYVGTECSTIDMPQAQCWPRTKPFDADTSVYEDGPTLSLAIVIAALTARIKIDEASL